MSHHSSASDLPDMNNSSNNVSNDNRLNDDYTDGNNFNESGERNGRVRMNNHRGRPPYDQTHHIQSADDRKTNNVQYGDTEPINMSATDVNLMIETFHENRNKMRKLERNDKLLREQIIRILDANDTNVIKGSRIILNRKSYNRKSISKECLPLEIYDRYAKETAIVTLSTSEIE